MHYLRVPQVMEGLVDADGEEDNEVEVEAGPAGILFTSGIFTWFAAACPVEKNIFFSSLLAV